MSAERKVRRNIRQQQRKALIKYMRAKEQELNAKRKAEAQRVVYSREGMGPVIYTSQDYGPWELTHD